MNRLLLLIFSFVCSTSMLYAGRNVEGCVKDKQGGIGSVVVSDGYTIVATDSQGKYAFQAHDSATFVYLTVPAQYEIPSRYGLPMHYQRLRADGGRYDFVLKRRKQPSDNFVVTVTGDLHLSNSGQATRWETGMVADMVKLRKGYPKGTEFYGIFLGDIIWRNTAMFNDYKRIVSTLYYPYFSVIGHADTDHTTADETVAKRQYEEIFGPRYYGFNIGSNYFIVLDDNKITGAGKYVGEIDPVQMRWLKQYLSYVPVNSRVIVCLHIPTMRRRKVVENLPNTRELHAMLKPFEAHFMSAHTHWLENYKPYGRYEHIHPSACGVYWDEHQFCKDGTPIGYGVYEFSGKNMTSYYKSVGQQRDYQMAVYAPGEHPTMADRVVVNVWNWEDNWSVGWYEDGVLMGAMDRGYDYDPSYKWRNYKPNNNQFRNPVKIYHIFSAKPSASAKSVRIELRDPYGRKYSQEISIKKPL